MVERSLSIRRSLPYAAGVRLQCPSALSEALHDETEPVGSYFTTRGARTRDCKIKSLALKTQLVPASYIRDMNPWDFRSLCGVRPN
jgi:hypothetical protein